MPLLVAGSSLGLGVCRAVFPPAQGMAAAGPLTGTSQALLHPTAYLNQKSPTTRTLLPSAARAVRIFGVIPPLLWPPSGLHCLDRPAPAIPCAAREHS